MNLEIWHDRTMFIKKALKTEPKSGKTYTAFHLVESIRKEKRPRQRTLLYLGAELDLPSINSLLSALKSSLQASYPSYPNWKKSKN